SSTAFNMVATILQIMGEDPGFKFLAEMNKNVNQYTRSGTAGIRAAGKGETGIGIAFLHDVVAVAVEGFPVKGVAPCEGTGHEMDRLSRVASGAGRVDDGRQVPDSIQQERQDPSESTEARRHQVDQFRSRQIRVQGRARAAAEPLGEGSLPSA